MFKFFNGKSDKQPKVILSDDHIKKLKNSHGVVLFFMNGCGHCVDMKDEWDAAVDECRNTGIGNDNDDFILGAVESGNTDMFQKHGITHNVSGYPTILYITSEGIERGDTNHEKFQDDRNTKKFVEWIKNKKNSKAGKTGKAGKQSGGGKRRSYRRKSKSRRHTKRHTRRNKRTRRHH
jgi:hypothetical protein